MCGFTTFYAFDNISNETMEQLESANNLMRYRGPDEQGSWRDAKVAMSHVRLSIIGIENGIQPLYNEDQSLVLVCNGEIYNYIDLKNKLISLGHHFSSKSDCEVILHLFEVYKEESFAMLEGMFAFSLWDKNTSTLWLGRDHAGKKPLYYAQTENGFVFSSELKVIKNLFLQNSNLNFEVLRQTQKYTYPIDLESTYIQEIKRIPANHFIRINRNVFLKQTIKTSKPNPIRTIHSYHEVVEKTKSLLFEAVEKRLQAEVPVAILLSAGIDSSAIASIAKTIRGEVHVLSAGYKGSHQVDERSEAKKLSIEKGFVWHEIELDIDHFNKNTDDIFMHLDEPVADIAMFAQWEIYKKAKELGFKVLLSGNGGDELFYGYPTHNEFAEAEAWLNKQRNLFPIKSRKSMVKFLLQTFMQGNHVKLFRNINATNDQPVTKELLDLLPQNNIQLSRQDFHRNQQVEEIDRVYHFLRTAWLSNNCYFLADKLAMAHSIEIRCPFADQELIQFVDSLPIELKFPQQRPKGLLKDSLRDILPDYVLNRPKTGFTPPNSFVNQIINGYSNQFFQSKTNTFAQLITDHFAAN